MKSGRALAYTLIAVLLGFIWGFRTRGGETFPASIINHLLVAETPDLEATGIEQRPSLRALAALPYVSGTIDPSYHVKGVIFHDEKAALEELTFYNSSRGKSAHLITLGGQAVHDWSADTPRDWHSATLLPDGGILVIEPDFELIKLDVNSRVLWRFKGRVHHELEVFDDKIYILNRRNVQRPQIHPVRKTRDDTISVLSDDGTELEEISILDLFLGSPYAYLLPSLSDAQVPRTGLALDILHANHIEIFDGRHSDRSQLFKRGNMLLSLRNISSVLIVDGDTREIVWIWGPGNLAFQHHPQLLDNGNILLFDNGLEKSRIVEINPLTRQIVWTYQDDNFFSQQRGSVQRLSNGNTLITESNTGYAFEVDPSGEVVWRFANPEMEGDLRAPLWRMSRYSQDQLPFLAEPRTSESGH